MLNCNECGRKVKKKNAKYFRGKPYGSGCFKNHIVPKIEKIKQQKKDHKLKQWNLRAKALIKTLENKDLSNISNDFKLKVIPQLIEQFNNDGWLSKKQYDMAYDWLNQKDQRYMWGLMYKYHLIDWATYHSLMASSSRTGSTKYKYHRLRYEVLSHYKNYGRGQGKRSTGKEFYKDHAIIDLHEKWMHEGQQPYKLKGAM